MWQPIATAPFDRNLKVAVIDRTGGVHSLVFPCRRTEEGWLDVLMDRLIEVRPTHWRPWVEADTTRH
jgi:hypothetical protein